MHSAGVLRVWFACEFVNLFVWLSFLSACTDSGHIQGHDRLYTEQIEFTGEKSSLYIGG